MSKHKKNKSVSILSIPITVSKDKVFGAAVRDRMLIGVICKYADLLRNEDVEVFERKDNTIATEKGYFLALYDEAIRSMEGGIDNPTPFKGKDGRMKVQIIKEDGQMVIEDLAKLVAMAFAPNPNRYTKVWFKDWNPENVVDVNLFWISSFRYWIYYNLWKLGFNLKTKDNGTLPLASDRQRDGVS